MAALNRPLFVALMIFAVLFLRAVTPITFRYVLRLLINRYAAAIASVALVSAAVVIALSTAHTHDFLDHVEPNIAAVSWKLVHGDQLYLRPDALDRYSLVYGSAVYAWFGAILRVFGPDIAVLKWSVAGLNVAAFLLIWLTLKKRTAVLESLISLAYVAAVWLWMFPALVWVRADVLAFFVSCAGVAALSIGNPMLATFTLALVCGLLVSIKITFAFGCLPLLWLFHAKWGKRLSAMAVVGSAAVFFVPFLHPSISFENYLLILRQVSHHRLFFFLLNIRALLVLLLPLIALATSLGFQNPGKLFAIAKQNCGLLASTAAGLLPTLVVASKRGAGPHHLVPFVPVLALVFSQLLHEWLAGPRWSELTAVAREMAETTTLALMAVLVSMVSIYVMEIPSRPVLDSRGIMTDLRRILDDNPDRQIEMGYGTHSTYRVTWFRPVLVFAGQPLTLDPVSLMDSQYSGDDIPTAAVARLQSCRGKIWLVPRQDTPFNLQNLYADVGVTLNTFDHDFRDRFLQSYALSGHSQFFDIWSCKSDIALAGLKAERRIGGDGQGK